MRLFAEQETHRAITFMMQMHYRQKDKQGEPYFYHPLRVGLSLRNEGIDSEIAGYLHDVVEDCGVKLPTITRLFGEGITTIVQAVTWNKRTAETYSEFIKRAAANPKARMVKIADIKDNLSRMGTFPSAKALEERYRKALIYLEDTPLPS